MDNAQSSDNAPEKQVEGVKNKNDKATPGPPTEGTKTSQSVKSVSNPGARKSKETVEKNKKPSKNLSKSKSKSPEQKGETKIRNKDTNKTPVPLSDPVTPRENGGQRPGKIKQERYRALLLSWEVSWNPVGIAACLTNGNKISDFSYVALSPPTKDSEWTPPVDQSSIIILYSSPKSEKPLYEMERYLDYCSSKKGPEKVIVVIGEEDCAEKKWTAKWEANPFSRNLQQLRFSRAELDWITRKDILEEMQGKIKNMRNSLISPTGLQEKPTGNEENKDNMKKQQSSKQNNDNKTKKQQSQKENPSNNKTQIERNEKKSGEEMKQTVRIVSWSKTDSLWLLTLLQSPYFMDTVKDVETINVTGSEFEKITEQTSPFTTYILYFSKESLELFCSQLPNSVKLLSYFENKKIIVVIDNLDNKYAEKETTKLYNELPISSLSKHLFLFGKREKETDYLTYLTKNQQVAQEAVQKLKKFQNLINEKIGAPDPQWPGPRTVGIFSRSAKDDYEWLEKLLKSPKFQVFVKDVRPFYISNKGYEDFYKEVSNCSFGILYHTKNRGRVNITDVTDSLYDMEIEYMSTALGRCNVLVVIDDLKDSRLKEKERILYTQRSIPKYARNLLLVTPEEKKDEEKLLSKLMEIFVSPAIEDLEILRGANKESEKSEGVEDATKTDIKNDVKTDTQKSTNDSATEINTEKPAVVKGTNNSAIGNQEKDSFGNKNTETSVREKDTNNSAGEDTKNSAGEDTKNSAREKYTRNSAEEKDTRNSAGEEDTKNSTGEKDTRNSAEEKDTNNSAGEKDTKNSAGEKDTKNSAGEEDTKNSAGEKDTRNSAEEKDTNNSAREKDTKNSAGEDTKNSAGEKDTKNSSGEKDTKNSAGEKDLNNSAGEKDTKKSAGEKDTKSPAGEKDTKSPAGEKDTKSPAGEKDTKSPAGEKDTKNSTREKDTKSPAGEKDTKNSAGEKDTNNSTREKDTKNSAGEKDTKNSAREKDTKNSAGEKETKNSTDNTKKVDAGNDANNVAKGDEGKTNKQTEPSTAKETDVLKGAKEKNESEVSEESAQL